MRRVVFAMAGLLVFGSMVQAQTMGPRTTVSNFVVAPGDTVNVTIKGTPGQNYALIASTTNSGFSYGGVALQVGADVVILAVGVLGGSGEAVVPVTPPFPARDSYYVQGVVSASPDFLPPTPANSVTLVNASLAPLLPLGGIVNANGTPFTISNGVTVGLIAPSVYRINHPNSLPTAIPIITPMEGATVVAISVNNEEGHSTIALSKEATFFFTLQALRP